MSNQVESQKTETAQIASSESNDYSLFGDEPAQTTNKDSDEEYVPSEEEILPEEYIIPEYSEVKTNLSNRSVSSNFDELVSKRKKLRETLEKGVSHEIFQQTSANLLKSMHIAYTKDKALLEKNKIALNRLEFLDILETKIKDSTFLYSLLSRDLISYLTDWLFSPVSTENNIVIASLAIRTKIYDILSEFTIPLNFIKDSKCGERLLYVWHHPDEISSNKSKIRNIVKQIYKQILKLHSKMTN